MVLAGAMHWLRMNTITGPKLFPEGIKVGCDWSYSLMKFRVSLEPIDGIIF